MKIQNRGNKKLLTVLFIVSSPLFGFWTPWSTSVQTTEESAQQELKKKLAEIMKEIHAARELNDLKALTQLNYKKTAEIDLHMLYNIGTKKKGTKNTDFPTFADCKNIIHNFETYAKEYGTDVINLTSHFPMLQVKDEELQRTWSIIQQENWAESLQPLYITWQYKQRNNVPTLIINNKLVINAAFFPFHLPLSQENITELHKQSLALQNLTGALKFGSNLVAGLGLSIVAGPYLHAGIQSVLTAGNIDIKNNLTKYLVGAMVAAPILSKASKYVGKGVNSSIDYFYNSGNKSIAEKNIQDSRIQPTHKKSLKIQFKKPDFAHTIQVPELNEKPSYYQKGIISSATEYGARAALIAGAATVCPAILTQQSPLNIISNDTWMNEIDNWVIQPVSKTVGDYTKNLFPRKQSITQANGALASDNAETISPENKIGDELIPEEN